MATFALVDCNNFYASCERLFQPRLRGLPVVVLSNNDGCVIARSAGLRRPLQHVERDLWIRRAHHPGGRRGALRRDRHAAEPDPRGRRDGALVGQRGEQCAPPESYRNLKPNRDRKT